MKNRCVALAACLALVLAVGTVFAEVKSGPQVGKEVPGPFHPLNVTGQFAGQKFCLFCKNGENPVAMIFARELNEPVVRLIKQIDQATARNSDCHMGSFVVFCSNDETLPEKLKKLAQKEKIEHTVLSIDNPAGPQGYELAQDAEVTVVLYTNRMVRANHAFRKGELKDQEIEKIVRDLSKITSK